ncbi:MAG TPA: hypothetical protein VKA12_07945, partial [Roseiarcus sp.]|nr:hypothetical protein [Roseiarcus sp.]
LPEGIYFDKRTPAFGIRVGKKRKTWVVLKEPNRTKLRIGHYPDLSLATREGGRWSPSARQRNRARKRRPFPMQDDE